MTQTSQAFSGDQLRLARMAIGRPLEQVASEVAITRQYLHQLETGSKKPSAEMESALADVLGVRTAFFYLAGGTNVRPEQVHFRKQLTTPASITSQVIARGTLLDRVASELDSFLKLPRVDFPDFPANSIADAEIIAIGARKHWGLGTDGPISSVVRIAENAGAIVTYFAGLSERVDALSMDRPRPIIVRSDAKASLSRQRFDLAHEIGHLVMHRGIETGDRDTEDQAHRFAGAFLIPATAFLREYPRSPRLDWPGLFAMKRRWKVAVRAIVHRAYDLGLISAAQYRTANIQIVKTGQAKAERYDDEWPLEEPELLETAVAALGRKPGRFGSMMKATGLDLKMLSLLVGRQIEPPASDVNVVPFRQLE